MPVGEYNSVRHRLCGNGISGCSSRSQKEGEASIHRGIRKVRHPFHSTAIERASDTEPDAHREVRGDFDSRSLALLLVRQVLSRDSSNHPHVNGTTREFVVEDPAGQRLDVYLATRIDGLSRSSVQRLIDSAHVLVNGSSVRSSHKVQPGDRISVTVPPPEQSDIAPEQIALDIVYEDNQIIVVNKPSGMTVHPAPGSKHGTLVNAILAHSDDLSGIGGVERPGIVHRLDKDTSGLLVVAKTDPAHASLQLQLQERTAERRYMALVWGKTKFNRAVVDAPIGRHPNDRQRMAVIKDTGRYTARTAITNLTVLERFAGFTLLEAKLDTGRTHQIRVHCSFIGHPVVGDPTYGGTNRSLPASYDRQEQRELAALIDKLRGQALHAYSLSFNHPTTGERLAFDAPPPREMAALLDWLRGRSAR